MLLTVKTFVIQLFLLAAETTTKIADDSGLKLRPESWQQTLPALIIGMLGIFLVIGIIILSTYFLNKAFSKKKKNDEE